MEKIEQFAMYVFGSTVSPACCDVVVAELEAVVSAVLLARIEHVPTKDSADELVASIA